ncbi:MAG: ABC transporter permease [Firmicutes bacterium]|nr:ABC transporter permease [Dethiobacter sp.]MBS3888230.1 ABC transporter permease [Bacillota bacterium]MBS4054008.1 ABC transporter permease [Thermaerobacter sp.]
MAHIFKYRLKILLSDKTTMFWTLVFPMVLAGLFSLAFAQIEAGERFAPIDTALVDSGGDEAFVALIESLAQGDDRLFNLVRATESEGLALLAAGEVHGVIATGRPLTLSINEGGFKASILKTFVDSYLQSSAAVTRIASDNPAAVGRLASLLAEEREFLVDHPLGRGTHNFMIIHYLSLLAMTCLLGGYVGMSEISAIEANLSHHAARVSLAPVHKLKVLAAGISAALILQFSKLLLYFGFLVLLLDVDFGSRTPWVVVTILLCTLLGITFGAFVTALVRGTTGLKEGILLAVSLAGASLAGMNVAELKYIVETHTPWLALMNPAHHITDAFYTLYYFDTYERFVTNVVGLVVFTILFTCGTYCVVRRRVYVSI